MDKCEATVLGYRTWSFHELSVQFYYLSWIVILCYVTEVTLGKKETLYPWKHVLIQLDCPLQVYLSLNFALIPGRTLFHHYLFHQITSIWKLPAEEHKRKDDTQKLQPQEVNVNMRIKKRALAVPRDEIAAAVKSAACLVINLTWLPGRSC